MLIKNVGNSFTVILSNTNSTIILAVFARVFCLPAQKGKNLFPIFNMGKTRVFKNFFMIALILHSNLHCPHSGKNKTRKQNPPNLKFILLKYGVVSNCKNYFLCCSRVIMWLYGHSSQNYTPYWGSVSPFLTVLSSPLSQDNQWLSQDNQC